MENMDQTPIKLTEYSHGAGCGCKISPAVLDKILHHPDAGAFPVDKHLLVGNDKRDDAAVLDIGNGMGLISTTDFFMPIVDDPYDFGRIAAANAISDVYAMGGKPILALAILGWPINRLAPEIAQRVLQGARQVCAQAGITLAGGHSIDCPEPVFGLSVNGLVPIPHLKQNSSASAGCYLYLTKALGVGVLSTAQKKGLLNPTDAAISLNSMTTLNKAGQALAEVAGVKAMTDVTGFGLLGHLVEMCTGSKVAAVIKFDQVPVIAAAKTYLAAGCIPGGTGRNWESYGDKIGPVTDLQRQLLADPQTSGGLLIAVEPQASETVEQVLRAHAIEPVKIGRLTTQDAGPLITIE